MDALSEKDWCAFKALKADALECYCASILAESAALSADVARTAHERYLAVYALIHIIDCYQAAFRLVLTRHGQEGTYDACTTFRSDANFQS